MTNTSQDWIVRNGVIVIRGIRRVVAAVPIVQGVMQALCECVQQVRLTFTSVLLVLFLVLSVHHKPVRSWHDGSDVPVLREKLCDARHVAGRHIARSEW